jgi:hypothetical protein
MLSEKAWVALYAMRFAEAEKDLARLATLDPLAADLNTMQESLRLFCRLGAARARGYIRMQLSVPFPVAHAMEKAGQAGSANDRKGAIRHAEAALRWAAAHPRACPPAAQVAERCWSLLAELYLTRGDVEGRRRGAGFIERLRRRHPDWPSPILLSVKNDRAVPLPEAIRRYRRAAAMRAPSDVLDLEMQGRLGIDLRAYVGFFLVKRAAEELHRRGEIAPADVERLAAEVKRFAPAGPARALLGFLEDSAWAIRVGKSGREPNAAERKRGEAMARAMARFPLDLPDAPRQADVLSLLAVQASFRPNAGGFDRMEGGPAVEAIFRKFTRAINADWNCPPAVEQAAQTSLSGHLAIAQVIEGRVAARIEEAGLTARAEQGLPEEIETISRVDRIVSEELARLGEIPAFSRALLRHVLANVYPRYLRARDASALARETMTRQNDALLAMAKAPTTKVELRAASLWIDGQLEALADAPADASTAHRLTRWNAARSRLRLRLAAGK